MAVYEYERSSDGKRIELEFPLGSAPRVLNNVGDNEVWRMVMSAHIHFPYGQDQFHGPTIKERQEQQIADAKAGGLEAEPVGARWV